MAEIQTKDGSQWFKFEENITVRLREFINDLEEYHDRLEKQFYKFKTVVVMNGDKLAQSDQAVLAEAMDKIVSAKVAKLTCHEVSQVVKSINLSNSTQKIQIDEQFKKVEEKIGEDLLERFYFRFSNVPKRIVEKSLSNFVNLLMFRCRGNGKTYEDDPTRGICQDEGEDGNGE